MRCIAIFSDHSSSLRARYSACCAHASFAPNSCAGANARAISAASLATVTRKRVRDAARALGETARVLDTLSYRAVLARGFTLVRGADGQLRRRAATVNAGEKLTITFADGERSATASGAPEARPMAAATRGGKGTKGRAICSSRSSILRLWRVVVPR